MGRYLAKIEPKKLKAHSFELKPIIIIGVYSVIP